MDLNLLPIARENGEDLSELSGVHTASPPRRPARGRQADRLILYFILEGGAPLSQKQQGQFLEKLAQTYYKTPGSVTAALRAAAETLNQLLFERNLGSAGSQQGVGLLTLIALRGEQIFLGQCGPMQTFLMKATGVDHLHDPDATLRGLGLGRATSIHFSQAALSPGDTLVVSHRPPSTWSTVTLNGLHGQGPEGMRRRLLNQAGPDVRAILVQARNGPGQVHVLQPQPLPTFASPRAGAGEPDFETGPQPQTAGQRPADAPEMPVERPGAQRGEEPAAAPPTQPVYMEDSPAPVRMAQAPAPALEERTAPPLQDSAAASPDGSPASPAARPAPPGRSARRALGSFGRSILAGLGKLAVAGQTLTRRMLPGEGALPSSVMALFAVAIPLVVVTVSMVVYFERGRTAQYQVFYAQAVQAAWQAQEQADPPARRAYWEAALANLDQAEQYRRTPESEALRAEAQGFFDELEAIERLDFQPAVAGLPGNLKITRMAATNSEIFMLDANSGNAVRAFLAGQSYEYDDSFQCGPGYLAGQNLGPLIDIAPLPQGNQLEASLLAMDAQGNLIQCTSGEAPILNVLAPPATNWGEPRAFTLDSGDLYVLDPETNAVWVYWGSAFTTQPQFFFSEEVPPMQDVIDLAVDKTDLYLLHADGHVTLCTFSSLGVSPTRCTEPVPYIDSRAGREGRLLIPEAPFTQIRATQPPDPSLYLLEAQSRAIYHFSLRLLTFQRQFRSKNPLPSTPASAFAIRPDSRMAFLAFDSRVFYAGLP